MEGGQRGDGRVRPRQHEVELAERLERGRVGIARGGDRAAQGAGNQVWRHVTPPRAIVAE